VDSASFWKALIVQALAVAALTGVMIALPLGDDFFEDWGYLTGPAAWLVASFVTARVLSLPLEAVLFSAIAGAVAGLIVLFVASHWPGVIAALLVFAASCGSYDESAEPISQRDQG
jgi:hypothetical protein